MTNRYFIKQTGTRAFYRTPGGGWTDDIEHAEVFNLRQAALNKIDAVQWRYAIGLIVHEHNPNVDSPQPAEEVLT